MTVEVFREFGFESAHFLPHVPEGHKCARMHGHSFRVRVSVQGRVGSESGWVMDFADVKGAVQPSIDALDHRVLNDVDGLDNPTSENVARWLWNRVAPELPGLSAVEVRETCTSGCVYRGEDR